MRRQIVIVEHARSGSTYFCRLLSAFKNIESYHEIFHFDLNMIRNYLGKVFIELTNYLEQITGKSITRDDLVLFADEYLDFLHRKNLGKIVSFKVFPGHLPLKTLEEIISTSSLVIILRRNLLHSFISNKIAEKIKIYALKDTSYEKILFSPKDFIEHSKTVIYYYKHVQNFTLIHNIPILFFDYEELTALQDPLSYIKEKLEPIFGKLEISDKFEIIVTKQDKRRFAHEKVINQDEMKSFLRGYNLEHLDDSKFYCNYEELEFLLNII